MGGSSGGGSGGNGKVGQLTNRQTKSLFILRLSHIFKQKRNRPSSFLSTDDDRHLTARLSLPSTGVRLKPTGRTRGGSALVGIGSTGEQLPPDESSSRQERRVVGHERVRVADASAVVAERTIVTSRAARMWVRMVKVGENEVREGNSGAPLLPTARVVGLRSSCVSRRTQSPRARIYTQESKLSALGVRSGPHCQVTWAASVCDG